MLSEGSSVTLFLLHQGSDFAILMIGRLNTRQNFAIFSGNLVGDRKHAQWNPIDFILLLLKGVTNTLSAPDVDWQLEMTPVDFVTEMIVKMAQV